VGVGVGVRVPVGVGVGATTKIFVSVIAVDWQEVVSPSFNSAVAHTAVLPIAIPLTVVE